MRTTQFIEHPVHAKCALDVDRKEDDGSTTYFDPFHVMYVVERVEGQTVEEWYAARAR
jgi:hypothetical protein